MNLFAKYLDSVRDGSAAHWKFVVDIRTPGGLWQSARREVARLRQFPDEAAASVEALREFAGTWRQLAEAGRATATPDRWQTLGMLDALIIGFTEAVQPTLGWEQRAVVRPVSLAGEDDEEGQEEAEDGREQDAFHFHQLLLADEPPPSARAPFVVVGKNRQGSTVGAEVLCLEFRLVSSAGRQARLHPLAEFSQPLANIDEEFRETIRQAWRLASQPTRFRSRVPLGLWWQVHDLQGNPPACEEGGPRLSGPSAGGAAFRALVGALRRREPSLPLPTVLDAEAVCVMAKLAKSAREAVFVADAVQDIAVKGRALVQAIRKHRDRREAGHPIRFLDTIAVARLTTADREAVNTQIRESGLENVVRVMDLGMEG